MRQGGLGPPTKEIPDIGVFGRKIPSRRFHDGSINIGLQHGFLAVCQKQFMNLAQEPPSYLESTVPHVSAAGRTDLCRACKKVLDS